MEIVLFFMMPYIKMVITLIKMYYLSNTLQK